MPSMHSPSFWQGLGEQLSMSMKRKVFILCPINLAIWLKSWDFPYKAIKYLIELIHTYFTVHSCKSNGASTSIWSNSVNTCSTILARVWFTFVDICINKTLVCLSWKEMMVSLNLISINHYFDVLYFKRYLLFSQSSPVNPAAQSQE